MKRLTVEGFCIIEWRMQRPQPKKAGRNGQSEVKCGTESRGEGRWPKGLENQAGTENTQGCEVWVD